MPGKSTTVRSGQVVVLTVNEIVTSQISFPSPASLFCCFMISLARLSRLICSLESSQVAPSSHSLVTLTNFNLMEHLVQTPTALGRMSFPMIVVSTEDLPVL